MAGTVCVHTEVIYIYVCISGFYIRLHIPSCAFPPLQRAATPALVCFTPSSPENVLQLMLVILQLLQFSSSLLLRNSYSLTRKSQCSDAWPR